MWFAGFLFVFLFWSGPLAADARSYQIDLTDKSDEITVYVNHLQYRATGESGGQYDLLMDELFAESSFKVSRVVAPLSRAGKLFLAEKKSCLFPTGSRRLDNRETAHLFVGSIPADYFSLKFYTLKGNAWRYTFLESLKDARIGYIAGSGAIRTLGEIAENWIPVETEAQLISMSRLGRLEGFVGHYPDTQIAMEKLGAEDLLQVVPLLYDKVPESAIFLCHATEAGAKFIAEMNSFLDSLNKRGRVKQILGQYAIMARPNPHP